MPQHRPARRRASLALTIGLLAAIMTLPATGAGAQDLPPTTRLAPAPVATADPTTSDRVTSAVRAGDGWIDTADRAAVIAAYDAEFGRDEPATGFTGSTSSCQPGTTSAAYRASLLKRINWYRAMAGTGTAITENTTWTRSAQAAALIMAAENRISHTPTPDWACWTSSGADGAATSNLTLGAAGTTSMDLYMEDPGSGNASIGHRSWLLHPGITQMGLGDVVTPTRKANATKLFATGIPPSGDAGAVRDAGRYLSWPPPGYVPIETIHPRWSLQRRSGVAGVTDFSTATVSVRIGGSTAAVTPEYRSNDRIVFQPRLPAVVTDTAVTVTVSGILVAGTRVSRTWTTTILPVGASTPPFPVQRSVYVPITPCRVVDTRSQGGRFGPNVQRAYRITGTGAQFAAQGGKVGGCGIPAGATAVEATATAVAPSAANGFLRAGPSDRVLPNATFLNYTAGHGVTNTGAIPLGTGSTTQLAMRNYGGTSDYVIDLQGYFVAEAQPGLRYVAVAPCRVVDTRTRGGAFPPRAQRTYQVAGTGATFAGQGGKAGGCGVPAGAEAVEATVTAIPAAAEAGYARAWPAGQAQPNATFVNYSHRQPVTNTGAIPLAAADTDQLAVANAGGTSDFVIELQGYYTRTEPGSVYVPIVPCRAVDTRTSGGLLAAAASRTFHVSGFSTESVATRQYAGQGGAAATCDVPHDATAVEASLTAVAPASAKGYARIWATSTPAPNATFLNYTPTQSITNTGAVPIAPLGDLDLSNHSGSSHYVVDIQGYFTG